MYCYPRLSAPWLAALLLTAAPAYAQSTSSDVGAAVFAPSTVTKVADLQFGTIIAGTGASTVTVNPVNGQRTVAGTAIAFGGTISPAKFDVSSRPLLIYIISVPPAAIITNGGNSMTINNFQLNVPRQRLLPFLAPRLTEFQVGGTLNVGAKQASGTYTGSFTVTVDYL